MGLGGLQRHHVAELRSIGNFRQRLFLCRVFALEHVFAVKLHFVLGAFQQFGTQLANLSAQLHGAFFGGLAGDINGAGRVGAGVIG